MPNNSLETLTSIADASTDQAETRVTGTTVGTKRGMDVVVIADGSDTTTTGTPVGITVSTTAVLLAAANTDRKAILITNNSLTGNLFIGHTTGVTSSGVTMGLLLNPKGGTYSDDGDGIYTGALYGILSEAAASQNVSVSERT